MATQKYNKSEIMKDASSIASMLSYLMSVWLAFTVTGFIREIDNYTLMI